jgi:hypothetical protein
MIIVLCAMPICLMFWLWHTSRTSAHTAGFIQGCASLLFVCCVGVIIQFYVRRGTRKWEVRKELSKAEARRCPMADHR